MAHEKALDLRTNRTVRSRVIAKKEQFVQLGAKVSVGSEWVTAYCRGCNSKGYWPPLIVTVTARVGHYVIFNRGDSAVPNVRSRTYFLRSHEPFVPGKRYKYGMPTRDERKRPGGRSRW